MWILASNAFFIRSVQADWAYSFVVYDGNSYTITDSKVEKDYIDELIGKVTSYSDREGTYSGNFSNYFPRGTEYYSIKGVQINKAIAIKVSDGSFIKADYQGEYAGAKFDWIKPLLYVVGIALLVIVIFMIKMKK